MDDTSTIESVVQKYLLELRPEIKLTSPAYIRTHSLLVELLLSDPETPDIAIRITASKLEVPPTSVRQSVKAFFTNAWFLPNESAISLAEVIGTSIRESESPTPPPINTFLIGSVKYLSARL